MPSLAARIAMSFALLGAVALAMAGAGRAQEIDFSKIDKLESLSSGTLRAGSPPKTILDDDERHVIVLTIWSADADWRSSADANTNAFAEVMARLSAVSGSG